MSGTRVYFLQQKIQSKMNSLSAEACREVALKIRDDARASMHKAPASLLQGILAMLPDSLRKYANAAPSLLYRIAAKEGIPVALIQKFLRAKKNKGRIPSPPGQPPLVQTGKMKQAIIVSQTKTGLVRVGTHSDGWYLRIHEMGLANHPKRPVLKPAMMRHLSDLPEAFKGKLKE